MVSQGTDALLQRSPLGDRQLRRADAIASFSGRSFRPEHYERAGTDRVASSIRTAARLEGHRRARRKTRTLKVTLPTEARRATPLKRGKRLVAIVIPKGSAMPPARRSSATARSRARILFDPSRSVELAMVRGVLTQHVMEAVSRRCSAASRDARRRADAAADRGVGDAADQKRAARRHAALGAELLRAAGRRARAPTAPRGITMPYTVREEAMTAGSNIAYNGYAHSFAGMAIQFLLFAMANCGDRDAARAPARPVEAPAQRAGLEADAARRKGGQRRDRFADDPARVVRVRDGSCSACASRAASPAFSASRSPAR
jgi:bifunctional DNA-binding transcriptional regulator/antitoxin component of YhaV-PrlF toxin-antitoxin module